MPREVTLQAEGSADGTAAVGGEPRPLRLLVVDDSVNDFDLLMHALRKGPFSVSAQRVESEKELRAALADGSWDAAVIDHVIPGYGGPQALKHLRDAQPDMAVVVVSGKVDEEAIAADLRMGADDYVFKSDLARVIPALEQALTAAESRRDRRRTEEALRAEERRYRRMVEAAGVALLEIDHSGLGRLLERAGVADQLGLTTGPEQGGATPDVQDRSEVGLTRSALMEEALSPVASMLVDNAALMEEAFRLVRPVDCNQWALTLFECSSKEEFFSGFAEMFTAEALPATIMLLADVLGGVTSTRAELPLRTVKGRPIVCLVTITCPSGDESDNTLFVAVSDITERWQAERRLQESERRYRLVAERGADVIWVIDVESQSFRYVSPSVERLRGYTVEEVMEQGLAGALTPESLRFVRENVADRLAAFEAGERRSYVDIMEQPCKDGSTVWTEVVTTFMVDEATGRLEAHGISRDITERRRAEQVRNEHAERLRRTVEGAVLAMGSAVERRDPYTAGHERRVTQLAEAIGRELGLDDERLEGIRLAGSVHDIGKIGVPAEILSKPGRLRDYEFSLVKRHPAVGAEILQPIEFVQPVAQFVLQHHERMDGSGYPSGLRGEEILLEARILAVADVFEAMASHRPYRPALGDAVALDEIRAGAGTRYDADVAAACERIISAGFSFQSDG